MRGDANRPQVARGEQARPSGWRSPAPAGALLLAGVCGMLLGYGLASLERVGSEQPALAALQRELEEERQARDVLIRLLERAAAPAAPEPQPLAAREEAPPTPGDEAVSAGAATAVRPVPAPAPAPEKAAPAARAAAHARPERPWFDRAALEVAGLSSSEIHEIEGRFEDHEMDKLYLTDQSKRDGSFRSPRFAEEVEALNRELREDLGPDGYDAYLYATGRNNRVVMRQVLENSPASYAGLEAGDLVVSYSGKRVFHPHAFKAATFAGEAGVAVTIEVLRDGEFYRYSVPRGPLGVRISGLKAPPLRGW